MTARVLRGEAPTAIGESRAAQARVHVGLLPRTTPKPYEVPVHLFDTITDFIVKNASSVQDVFEAWDKDKNKLLDKREFRDFLSAIGFMVPKEASDAVFDEFDDDGSGFIDYSEFVRQARKLSFARGKIPKPKVQPGNPSVTRFNDMWAQKNQEQMDKWTKKKRADDVAAEAQRMADFQAKRTDLVRGMRGRHEESRKRGTALLEPYRLRQLKDEKTGENVNRMWEQVWKQEVVFFPPILTARVTAASPRDSPRRCLIEERTPRHTRERPRSRSAALTSVHALPAYDEVDEDGFSSPEPMRGGH